MIILKKKHDLVVRSFEEKIERLKEENSNKITKLETKNCNLNTELVSEKAKVSQLEEANHQLHQELEELKLQREKYEKTIDSLGKVYNSMNRKLWANTEAQRQMRNLSDNILNADKINKSSLSKYIYDLSMLIGGGEEFEYAGLKINTEEEAVG